MSQFEAWLNTKLQELKTDETVFGPYIISILEGDEETEEEKREGLTGILSDCLDNEDDIEKALNDILMRWKSLSDQNNDSANKLNEDVQKLDITEKMRAITQEKIANTKVKKFEKSEEEKKLKEAILSGYREGGDGSEEDEDDDGDTNLGPANSNAESVKQVNKIVKTVISVVEDSHHISIILYLFGIVISRFWLLGITSYCARHSVPVSIIISSHY